MSTCCISEFKMTDNQQEEKINSFCFTVNEQKGCVCKNIFLKTLDIGKKVVEAVLTKRVECWGYLMQLICVESTHRTTRHLTQILLMSRNIFNHFLQ